MFKVNTTPFIEISLIFLSSTVSLSYFLLAHFAFPAAKLFCFA